MLILKPFFLLKLVAGGTPWEVNWGGHSLCGVGGSTEGKVMAILGDSLQEGWARGGHEEALPLTQTCIGSPIPSFFWASGSSVLEITTSDGEK